MTSPYNSDYSSVKPEEDYPVPAQDVDLEAMMARWQVSSRNFIELTEEMKSLDSRPEEYWYAIGSRLRIIHDEQLYRNVGYPSFSGYCKSGQNYSRQHAYKLMKVTEYIDQQWAQATSPVAKSRVQRLFSLGFGRLYLLYSLPDKLLDRLLEEGITILVGDTMAEQKIPLESAKVTELRRLLQPRLTFLPRQTGAANCRPVDLHRLNSMIRVQSKVLVQLIEKCQQDVNCPEVLSDSLQTIRRYTDTIVEEIAALAHSIAPLQVPTATKKDMVNNTISVQIKVVGNL